MFVLAPHHRKIVTGNYPGGWIGIKPIAPTINWSNVYMQRCVGKEDRTAIVWCDHNRQPHELVRDESNLRPSEQAVPMIYDSEPCARFDNNPMTQIQEVALFTGVRSPALGQPMVFIAMMNPITWNDPGWLYGHLVTNRNLFSNGCDFAFSTYLRDPGLDNSIDFYSNLAGIRQEAHLSVGIDGASWPPGTWGIWGSSTINDGATFGHTKARRPSTLDLTVVASHSSMPWNSIGNDDFLYIGYPDAFVSTSACSRSYLGFIYVLPIAVSELELIDLMDNPYQIFNW